MDNTSPPALQSDGVVIEAHEVGSMLHIPEAAVVKLTHRRKNALPSFRLGPKTRRYSRAAVMAWVATQSKKAS
jgi:hypothetical protein